MIIGFGSLLAFLICRMIFRNASLAAGVLLISLYFGFLSITGITQLISAANLIFTLIFMLTLFRCSLLASVVALWVYLAVDATPLSPDLDRWYSGGTLACILLIGSVLAFGYWRSLGGQSPLGRWSTVGLD